MPKRKIIKIIKELNKLIKEQFPDLKGLYLYGSQGKGTAHKNSDIDVIAIFEEVTREKKYEIGGILGDLGYKYDVYIDLHEYTEEDLQRNPIYYNEVVNKGQYYAAA